jgi:hypothetical protein
MMGKAILMRLVLVALAAVGLYDYGSATAAAEEAVEEKARLETVLDQLSSQLDTLERNSSLAQSVEAARARVHWFKGKLDAWSPTTAEEGRPLREGLEIDLQALRRVPADSQATAGVLAQVNDDLTIKAAHCKRAGLAALVTAKVRTLRAGKEVTGFEVYYIPKLLELEPPANPPRFPTLSATEQNLAPGRYVFWAGTLSRTGRKSTIAVGDGNSETRIDLLVP